MMILTMIRRRRPDRNTSPVEGTSHPPMTCGFAVGISKDWKKSRALVGRRWPRMLGTAGRGVQLPPRAALGCPFASPTWVLPPLPVLVLTESLPAEKPLCASRPAAHQETALAQRPHLLLLVHHSCLLQLWAQADKKR